MIRSMTGFGSAERQFEQWLMRAEVRSVNHKELQISFRTPDALKSRETALQKIMEKHVSRGHLYLWLNCEGVSGSTETLVDEERLAGYLRVFRRVAEQEGVALQADIGGMIRLPEVLSDATAEDELTEQLWPGVLETVGAAMESLVDMRREEGRHLARQLIELADGITGLVDRIEQEQDSFVPGYRDRLLERIDKLLQGTGVEVKEETIAREVAVYADRSDVSEEIARLRSHVSQFRDALQSEEIEPVGRKMEFLGQEMLRESGTIAAKVPAGPQVEHVLDLKSHVEKLREQVRNVE
jgi:uncharacterized protein (TIGR00255 family)